MMFSHKDITKKNHYFLEIWTTGESGMNSNDKVYDKYGSPSSSSRIWSRPTFWPRECFALAPQTIALYAKRWWAFDKSMQSDMTDYALFHLFCYVFMNGHTEIIHRAFSPTKYHRLGIIWGQPSWLCVNSDQVKGRPHFVDKFVDI